MGCVSTKPKAEASAIEKKEKESKPVNKQKRIIQDSTFEVRQVG